MHDVMYAMSEGILCTIWLVRPSCFFVPDSEMLKGVSGGWPAILSNLKTLLETDETLPLPDEQTVQEQRVDA